MNDLHNGRADETPDWKTNGLRIIRSGELDTNTPQTPGMNRAEAISHARVGAQKLWAGTVVVHPNARTGPHHHGELETVIYVVRGRARFRWGNNLEFVDEAGPGDFVYVPPYVPHQELKRPQRPRGRGCNCPQRPGADRRQLKHSQSGGLSRPSTRRPIPLRAPEGLTKSSPN
jgi:uncharacterized RmlC-like cupin family protein